MSSKEFKKLNKAELLEVIYRMQMREKTLSRNAEAWKLQAEQRCDILESAGNIAEASLGIHDVFAVAQKAADDYVAAVSARVDRQERAALLLLEKTRQIATSIQDFLGEMEGDEMGMDCYRQQIGSILQELEFYLPQETVEDP